ncbi:LlaJI family restriction endonuclease [Mammaliicoccus sciuri]|uniref:LlaJI family restriction endonuclease n=1 Tax=Mammaliicoccus sciuri TaxID=1296 RepID=UPI003A906C60
MNMSNIHCYNEGQEVPNILPITLEKRDTQFKDTNQGEMETLNFSGIIMEEDQIFVSFPKHYSGNNTNILDDIQLLFKTIMKHRQENAKLYLTKSVNLKTNFPFTPFFDIYTYYQKYGIYNEEFTEITSGYNGQISWKDTIKNSNKVVSNKGLMFLPFSIKNKSKKDVLISECMAYAIDYTIEKFSLFIQLPKVGGNSLQKNLNENRHYIIRELYNAKKNTFKDIHRQLISNLILFFEDLPSGGTYYLKHYTFSSIWEKIVEHYLNYHFEKIAFGELIFKNNLNYHNQFTKHVFHPNILNEKQNIQPDHYFYKNGEQYIFDAKYYNKLDGIDYKQLAYYFILKNYSEKRSLDFVKKHKITHNALLLPGDKQQKIHFKFKPEYNPEESNFIIYEYYLNVKKGMESYLYRQ